MLQFASSDSSAESEVAKAESMAWPARSPDLNPIQHVWDMLGRCIVGRSVPPGTLHELQQALLQEWALLPQQTINSTIASMPRRCQAGISSRGYRTRY
ncbi:hypothetical protein AVEN_118586-1 [Araneus ventricosus]|uniref:Tc1-like transposase DDE domain-containing protein n=1 Tax=Araneus ventricosus TaxID=182803 RepID=A0A4Y2AVU0_ARAVE|nr:hypothetical protein AVEN_118586-1 [Araneus ventricosus]